MPIYEGTCRRCGLVGVTSATCWKCPCAYCKKKGHLIADCPKALRCSGCGKKGHRFKWCREPARFRPKKTAIQGAPPTSLALNLSILPEKHHDKDGRALPDRDCVSTQHTSPTLLALNLSVSPEKHDDEDWRALPDRDCVSTQPAIIFPDLRALCTLILQEVVDEKLPGSDCFPYGDEIEAHGGIGLVTEDLLGLVRPEIKELQGQKITRSTLDSIRSRQTEPWPRYIGYLDYVIDDRLYEYLRLYIGQSQDSWRRILLQHIQAILQHKDNALHYFIIWLGNGHRTANFLMLWSCPMGDWDEWLQLRFNLLEALFCRAFSSHHGSLIPESSDDKEDFSGLGYGLNIASPLMQNAFMSEMAKLRDFNNILSSDDPQIKAFISFRSTLQNRKLRIRQLPWSRGKYEEALQGAVERHTFRDIKISFETPTHEQSQRAPLNLSVTSLFGSLSASIGFLLDYGVAGREPDSSSLGHEESNVDLPWVLDGIGFNQTNVLVWTCDFKRFSALSPSNLSTSPASDILANLKLHTDIPKASQLKVLLMCGPRAEEKVLSIVNCGRRYILDIRGHYFHFYVGSGNKSIATRLYIRCPELPLQTWCVDGAYAARLSEVIKFAVLMTGLENIRPYFLESSTALSLLFRQAWKEKQGLPRMTTDTLDPGLRVWLARKGFTDMEDIRKLEKTAGSLTQGLLVLTHVLPRRPRGKGFHVKPTKSSKQSKRKRGHFDTEMYETAKRHCQGVLLKREANFKEREGEPVAVGTSCSPVSHSQHFPTSEPDRLESQTPDTILSEFLAISEDKPDLTAEVQEVCFEQRREYLMGLGEQASPEDLQQIKYLLADEESRICELERLVVPMDLERGLNTIVQDSSPVKPRPGILKTTEGDIIMFAPSRQKFGPSQTEDWKVTRVRWISESGKFRGKLYPWRVPTNTKGVRQISLWQCRISFPKDMDCKDNKIYVEIDICAEHLAHPRAYARSAIDGDIAKRLAIKITGQDSTGSVFEFFPKVYGETAVFRANSFADILLGKDIRDIAKTPRRFLTYRRDRRVPIGLEMFEGGAYILDSATTPKMLRRGRKPKVMPPIPAIARAAVADVATTSIRRS